MDLTLPVYIAIAVLGILVAIHSVVLLGMLHMLRDGRSTEPAAPGPEPLLGEPAPAFTALDLDGRRFESEVFADHKRVLLFVSPSCSACAATLADLRLMNAKGKGRVIAVCSGTESECQTLMGEYRASMTVVVDELNQIASLYEIRSFPTAVVIAADNTVDSRGEPRREVIDAAADGAQAPAV